jgi:GntP family gluconate:H+ symporter
VAVIGYGATTTSWMNDSGFWIVCKMAGLSESETLKTWTVLLTVVAVTGFLWVRLVAWIFPLT